MQIDMYSDVLSFYLTGHTGGPLYGPKEKRDGDSNMEERVSPQVDTTGPRHARTVREVSGEFLLISTLKDTDACISTVYIIRQCLEKIAIKSS